MQLQQDLHRPELLTPQGKTPQIALPLPLAAPRTVERATGRLVISAPESLQVTPEKTVGLRSISFREAYEGLKPPTPRSQSSRGQFGPTPTTAKSRST